MLKRLLKIILFPISAIVLVIIVLGLLIICVPYWILTGKSIIDTPTPDWMYKLDLYLNVKW